MLAVQPISRTSNTVRASIIATRCYAGSTVDVLRIFVLNPE